MGSYVIPMGFFDRQTTKDVLRGWSVLSSVAIVAQFFFPFFIIGIFLGSYRIPIGFLWDSYCVHDDVDNVVVVVVDVVVVAADVASDGDDGDGDGDGDYDQHHPQVISLRTASLCGLAQEHLA